MEIPNAKNQLATAAVFADSTDATSAVLGIYIAQMNTSTSFRFLQGDMTVYPGLSSDELVTNTGDPNEISFYQNSVNKLNGINVTGLWQSGYTSLYQINACIEGVTSSPGLTPTCKNQLLGECKFMRALVLFNLTNLYGEIPLVLTTDFQTNAKLPRAPIAQIYQQMIADLKDAQSLLKVTYPSSGPVRPNQYAATALLARVYLYNKQWADAETAATQVINSGAYSLEPNLNDVFLANSKEAILQFIPVSESGAETAEGFVFTTPDSTYIPSYSINSHLLSAFEANDQRKLNWLRSNTISGTTYYYPFKYQFRDGDGLGKNYYMILRLAEQYLIRAEARAQQGTNLSGAAADINMIRSRAGLPPTTAASASDLLTAVYHERQTELFVESGHRWFDLKRTGLVNTVMGTDGVCAAKGGTWNADWALYPVPYTEIQANPFLTENPGY